MRSISGDEYDIDHNAEMSQSEINALWMNGEDCENACTHTQLWQTTQSYGGEEGSSSQEIDCAVRRSVLGEISLRSVAGPWTSTMWSGSQLEAGKAWAGNQIVVWLTLGTLVSLFFHIKQIVLIFISALLSHVWRHLLSIHTWPLTVRILNQPWCHFANWILPHVCLNNNVPHIVSLCLWLINALLSLDR